MKPSGLGFLLLDSSLRLIYANSEAARILTYPGEPAKLRSLDESIGKKIRSQLHDPLPSLPSPSLTPLSSGKRRYLCRAFSLEFGSKSPFAGGSFQPAIAVLIERSDRVLQKLAHVAEQYRLTRREGQTIELVMHGATNKEIAAQMKISPSTVKGFLRLIMAKLGVSTRSGILGKVCAEL